MYFKRYKFFLFTILLFVVLFIYLQIRYRYHFYFVEQIQLFQFSQDYLLARLSVPGGTVHAANEFLTQFYIQPFMGSLITSALLTFTVVLFYFICKKIAPRQSLYLLYALPLLALLPIQFNMDYLPQGTIAYLLALSFFRWYLNFSSFGKRMVWAAITVPFVLWTCGSVVVLYGSCILLWELLNNSKHWYWVFLIVVEVTLLTFATVYFAQTGSERLAFLPDMYFNPIKLPKMDLYYSWFILPITILIAFLLDKKKPSHIKIKQERIITGIQVLLIVCILVYLTSKYDSMELEKVQELDYYARTEQWDMVLDKSENEPENIMELMLLNTALIEKGILGDSLFFYSQSGINGLFLDWRTSSSFPTVFSDIHFIMGNIGLAQEMAFEGYVSATNDGSSRMLKRLVQTNLIYYAWPIADRYLTILEKTLFYKKWAKQHRSFLYNEEKILQDPLLGKKRKALTPNMLSDPTNPERNALFLAENNPENKRPIEYLLSIFLLDKDLHAFSEMMEKYYGTEVLPTLPLSFQEAVLLCYINEPEEVSNYIISEAVVKNFGTFRSQIMGNQNMAMAKRHAEREYRNTFWYYYFFK